MRVVALGFILLLVVTILIYWQGTVNITSAFGGAVVQAGYMLSGRDTNGKPVGYAGTSSTPHTGSGGNPNPCATGGTGGCPCGQAPNLLGICTPCLPIAGQCL